MSYIASFLVSSTAYSITLNPGELSKTISLSPVVDPQYAAPVLYSISTNSPGDGIGQSDMGAEGYVSITGTQATAHRSIDNHGVVTTYFFQVVHFHPRFFPAPIGVGGPKNFYLPAGQNEPASTGVLPSTYKGGFVNALIGVK